MGKVVADITMSLDGFITGPDDGPGRGLGEGGERLHNWVMGRAWRYDDGQPRFAPADVDRRVLEQAMDGIGAGIIGRGMFDVTGGWGGNPPGGPGARYFVLTHSAPAEWVNRTDSPFTFVTDGIGSALAQAQKVAGDKDVGIGGGGDVIRQYLAAGLLDELRLHVAPVILGAGKPLFGTLGRTIELERTAVVESPFATHLTFAVRH